MYFWNEERRHTKEKHVGKALYGTSLMAQWVKNPPAYAGDARDTLNLWGEKSPWRKKMAAPSRILAWGISWTEEPGGLYSPWGSKELDTTELMAQGTVWSSFILECSQLYIIKVESQGVLQTKYWDQFYFISFSI